MQLILSCSMRLPWLLFRKKRQNTWFWRPVLAEDSMRPTRSNIRSRRWSLRSAWITRRSSEIRSKRSQGKRPGSSKKVCRSSTTAETKRQKRSSKRGPKSFTHRRLHWKKKCMKFWETRTKVLIFAWIVGIMNMQKWPHLILHHIRWWTVLWHCLPWMWSIRNRRSRKIFVSGRSKRQNGRDVWRPFCRVWSWMGHTMRMVSHSL